MLKIADTLKLPIEILQQHLAVLGKTGSGKTSTAKLAIEQVVEGGARVCILDPIKSDWWGLTSSSTGKRAGLPFHILGGPHGHVSLHSAAGKAIADVVASGALPLSIIDMADFEPGGQAKFFVDFAPALLRKMRGVVYLVIEEAHIFAPKERSGIGAENLSIHWAKTLATAGRSKGVRLVLVTQRTQALHNALLGSCDTMIAHRLTAPADQEPVVKWLKANTSADVLAQVAGSLASLKTGEGWICSGEAKLFERVQFPRISTYDNTATPTGDGDTLDIKTAAVDPEKLRAIIGDAVEKAKADDPRELRKQLAGVREQLAKAQAVSGKSQQASVPVQKVVEKPVLTDGDRALLDKLHGKIAEIQRLFTVNCLFDVEQIGKAIDRQLAQFKQDLWNEQSDGRDAFLKVLEGKGFQKILEKLGALPAAALPVAGRMREVQPGVWTNAIPPVEAARASADVQRRLRNAAADLRPPPSPVVQRKSGKLPVSQKILNAMAELQMLGVPKPVREMVALLSGYTNVRSPGYVKAIGELRTAGLVDYPDSDSVALTDAGSASATYPDAPRTSSEIQDRVCAMLGGKASEILQPLIAAYPSKVRRVDVASAANYTNLRSPGFVKAIGRLRTLGFVDYPDSDSAIATSVLFLEA